MPAKGFNDNNRYLQIAFNDDISSALRAVSSIPRNDRILIEAGTPFIKREGHYGIRQLSSAWGGRLVADLKTTDGAEREVLLARNAGATAATVAGSATTETINLFMKTCEQADLDSMIDMLGVNEPLKVMLKLKNPPDVVILHMGRDEEKTRGKTVPYKQVNKIRSKYSVIIAAAGGMNLKEARSAIFNGANMVVVNIKKQTDPWEGIDYSEDIGTIAQKFLETIE